jgi:CheY-like chemotaxis protein
MIQASLLIRLVSRATRHIVVHVLTVEAAIQLTQHIRPDLIIVDEDACNMDDLALCDSLYKQLQLTTDAFLFLGRPQGEQRLEHGTFLDKPYSINDVLYKIEERL